jgi:hypothetical protein
VTVLQASASLDLEDTDGSPVVGGEPRPTLSWLFDPLGYIRFFLSRRDRRTLDLVREDLREDLREMIAEGRTHRVFILLVIWWRSLREFVPIVWTGVRRLLPVLRRLWGPSSD